MQYRLNSDDIKSYKTFSNLKLPRHTSYPAVPYWNKKLTLEQASKIAINSTSEGSLSLYFHIPFCQQLCFYCGCSKEVLTRSMPQTTGKVNALIQGLQQEIDSKKAILANSKVKHIHFGGGTPTFLNFDEWELLWTHLKDQMSLEKDAEIAIEIDPRTVTYELLKFLKELGFNRLSLGVQDFDFRVQEAINRIQPYHIVENTVNWARDLGFPSINFDLIYGLPFQTQETIEKTALKVIALDPDRIAFYRLAVIPELFRWQRSFLAKDLPQGLAPLDLNLTALEAFTAAGYRFIGLDHFAKEKDELCQAFRNNTLHRNFQGMTAGKDQRILGFGPSSISDLGSLYLQNPHSLVDWKKRLDDPDHRYKSHLLSSDDLLRRELIQGIYSYGNVDIQHMEEKFEINFDRYFAKEQVYIQHLVNSGLIFNNSYMIYENNLLGRLLRRVFASAFDHYLPSDRYIDGNKTQGSQVG